MSYYQRVLKIIQKINLLRSEWVFFISTLCGENALASLAGDTVRFAPYRRETRFALLAEDFCSGS